MILLTGASGFIGRRLAIQLSERVSPGCLHCLAAPGGSQFEQQGKVILRNVGLECREVDLLLSAPGSLRREGESSRTIFHLAANTATWQRDHAINDQGTESLLRALGPLGPDTHLIFTSTTAVMDNRTDLNEPLRSDLSTGALPFSQY
jgi:nucleoside-diphosphate-sugar epimerase